MEKAQSVYTNKSISIATYFGGPLVAGFLTGHNFKVFGEKENQRFAIVTGIVSTLVVFELLFIIPDKIMNYVPHAFIPAIYTAIIYTLIQNTQESRINEYIMRITG